MVRVAIRHSRGRCRRVRRPARLPAAAAERYGPAVASPLIVRIRRIAAGRVAGWLLLAVSLAASGWIAWRVLDAPDAVPVASGPLAEPLPPPVAGGDAAPQAAEQALIALLEAPQRFVSLTPEAAVQRNALIPYAPGPVPPAAPLLYPRSDPVAYGRALGCLTAAIYYEAAGEPDAGQAAVFQGSERSSGCQFTFTCDGALRRRPDPVLLARARRVAEAVLSGRIAPTIGWATHYHTPQVLPIWATTLLKTTGIGGHIFYRMPGRLGSPGGFNRPLAGAEPLIAALVPAGLAGEDAPLAQPTLVPEALPASSTEPTPPPVIEAAPDAASAPVTGPTPLPRPAATPPARDGDYFRRPQRDTRDRLPM
jgi:spore germination cell wall hydrolase CwlJ-like protein